MKASHPLWQLFLFRLRTLVREPSALFWKFAFPILTALMLGMAFRERPLPELAVAVTEGPEAEVLAEQLEASPDLRATRLPRPEALEALRKGELALVLVPGERPELLTDPRQTEGRTARLATMDVLGRMHGQVGQVAVRERSVMTPGNRYIDFLIPGLLGFGLMSSAIWGVTWTIVQMRRGKLLKRLMATPMKRSHFLLSFLFGRVALALFEVFFFLAFARLLFDVRAAGSLLSLIAFGLLGTLSFGGLGLLMASRAQNVEMASGLVNLVTLPMMLLSGVFFSVSHFPHWLQTFVQLLPHTLLINGLRGIMVDGASLLSLWKESLVLGAWGVLPSVVALRIFRWT